MNLARKLAYSAGAVATAISYQAFSTYIIFFYVDVMKLPARLAAAAMVIYGIWNAVNDPLVGFFSDRTRTRWGRRTPFIAGGAVPFGIIFFFLWVPPFRDYFQSFPLFLYFLFFICLFDFFYTLCILNWSALFPEVFSSFSERAQVNSFRQTFGLLGLMVGIALPPLIYSSLGWGWMGAIFGGLISLALLVSLFGAREKKEYSLARPLALREAFKATFVNRSFLTFVFANLFMQYTFTIILATIPFFTKYVLGASPRETTLIFLAAFLTAVPMLYLWRKLAVIFGAKNCFIASLFTLFVSLIPLFFANSFALTLAVSASLGVGLAGFILVVDILLADVIDEDALKTGARREGMYFGVNAFITRFAIGLEALSMGAVFALTGYNPYLFTQSAGFLSGLRLLIAGLPMMALICAFAAIMFYSAGETK